jgi:hypothetical protein
MIGYQILISASFGPSTVRVNTETLYSGRREAGVVHLINQTFFFS